MSQLAFTLSSTVNRPPRPLLSRVAESAFWMARYVERAEHVARVLAVNLNTLLDVGDIGPEVEKQFKIGPLRIFLVDQAPEVEPILESPREEMGGKISKYLTFDTANPNSILTCITRARENARSIRENISSEMWEAINTLYWSLRGDEAEARFNESPAELLKQVTTGSLLFQGLADQTLHHGQIWQFIQLAKYLERIDVTCRVIETQFDILKAVGRSLEQAERNTHLLTVVRSCCASEAYRRSVGEIDADRIAAFLLLERNFPRSVCLSATAAHEAITAIHQQTTPATPDPAAAILGRLDADLHYTDAGDVAGTGLIPFLSRIGSATLDAAALLKKRYFLK